MTKLRNLTQNSSLFDYDLFWIWDGNRNRAVRAEVIKDYCQQEGYSLDSFISGRIADNVLYMTRQTGEEVVIGRLPDFDISDYAIQELNNVPALEPDKFLKVNAAGDAIEYSVADPQGDEIGVESAGVALGMAQNLNYTDGLKAILAGNTATITSTIIPNGYRDLEQLGQGDDPTAMNTGISYVIGEFRDPPDFPTSDYEGYMIKQKNIFKDKGELLIYYSKYGTYLKPKYAGAWSDQWFTMLTLNTDQLITANKTFAENNFLGFDRSSTSQTKDFYLISIDDNLYLKAYSDSAKNYVDAMIVNNHGNVTFPTTTTILLTNVSQEIRSNKVFMDGAILAHTWGNSSYHTHIDHGNKTDLGIYANDNYPKGTWRQAVGINKKGNVWFPETTNLVLTDKEQTITKKKTFSGGIQNNSQIRTTGFNSLTFDRWGYSGGENWYKMTPTGNLGGGLAITVRKSGNPDAMFIYPSGRVAFPNSYFSKSIFGLHEASVRIIDHHTVGAPFSFDQDIPEKSHIDKIQIRVDEPFDQAMTLKVGTPSKSTQFADIPAVDLSRKGVVEIPIAHYCKGNIKPVLQLDSIDKPTKGKAEVFLVVH